MYEERIRRVDPTLHATKPELKISGLLKQKDQSQMSSLAKNADTLFERTFSESRYIDYLIVGVLVV